jgi:hypothetical protein
LARQRSIFLVAIIDRDRLNKNKTHTFTRDMNPEKLRRLQEKVRTGGKGSVRRKFKTVIYLSDIVVLLVVLD